MTVGAGGGTKTGAGFVKTGAGAFGGLYVVAGESGGVVEADKSVDRGGTRTGAGLLSFDVKSSETLKRFSASREVRFSSRG